MKNKLILSLVILFLTNIAGYTKDNLVFPIKNYLTEDYRAGTQNWGVIELTDGTICFANNDGLLVKNGNDWYTYQTSRRQLLRVICAYQNKIYAGGGNEFGYFLKSFSGHYTYTSLSDKVSTKWGEIWRIIVLEDKVYLQGRKAVFVFDTKTDQLVNQIKSDRFIYFSAHEKQLLFQSNEGVYTTDLNFDNKKILCDKATIDCSIITKIFYIKEELYFFTLSNGIYRYVNNKIIPCDKPIHEIASNEQIYCAVDLKDKIIIGTVLDGIYVLDSDLNIIRHINTSSGLRNNTILSLGLDHNSNVWVGFDNGIGFMDINTGCLYYNFDKDIGAGYTSVKHGDYNYWGTNQGLFYTNDKQGVDKVSLIKGTQGQVWCMKQIGNAVYCGHHNGLFEVKGNIAQQIDETAGIMNILQLPANPDYYLVRGYDLCLLYKYSDGSIKKVSEIKTPIYVERNIKVDRDNFMWCVDGENLVRFKINIDKSAIDEYKLYSYPGDKHLLSFGGDILLWNREILYKFDAKTNSFVKDFKLSYSEYNRKDLIELFYCIPTDVFYKTVEGGNNFIGDLPKVKRQMLWNVQMLSSYSDYFILNGSNGFIHFGFSQALNSIQEIKVVLSEIKTKSKSDTEYEWIEDNKLNYSNNNIRFKFNSNDNPHIDYQYKLVGYDDNYSSFSPKNSKEYTNLPEGNYCFEIRAKDESGRISKTQKFDFTIAPPFYRSLLAKIIYLILLLGLLIMVFTLIQFLLKRKEKQLDMLRQKEIEELEKNHKIETLSKEKTIILIEKEKLEESFDHKQRELTNSTHNIIVKNNLLIDIKELLQSIYKETNINLRDTKLNKIFHLIDSNINNDEDWTVFESYFSEIHQNFFNKIKKDFPDISATDLKLCAYIKLNKSTKEIASLMNISARGVETSRYRLRKKLGLERNENIYNLLSKY